MHTMYAKRFTIPSNLRHTQARGFMSQTYYLNNIYTKSRNTALTQKHMQTGETTLLAEHVHHR